MDTALYLSGEYLDKHPSWHVEDSAWKASQVLAMLSRHGLGIHSVVEVGCGAGEILLCLQQSMDAACSFTGYEISPQALTLCAARANERLEFVSGDGLSGVQPHADLALALDVVEHVDDYPAFLRGMRERARYSIFHIPLDLSLLSLLTGLPLRVRKSAGHLHYFTRDLALAALEENGFHVIDDFYTRPGIERVGKRLTSRLARWPRLALYAIHPGLASLVLGGFSLMVLVEGDRS